MAYSVEHVILLENLYRLMNSGAKTYYRISWQRLNCFIANCKQKLETLAVRLGTRQARTDDNDYFVNELILS